MKDQVILVSGFGRCGTSLVMQMLYMGGQTVTGEWPAFEAEETGLGRFDGRWVARQGGAAVKLLSPDVVIPMLSPGQYKSIWLDRDPKQQARSQGKFMRLMFNMTVNRAGIRSMERSIEKDRAGAIADLMRIGEVKVMRFEELILNPAAAAVEIAIFCDLPVENIPLMVGAVLPRSTNAAGDLNIELALASTAPPSIFKTKRNQGCNPGSLSENKPSRFDEAHHM